MKGNGSASDCEDGTELTEEIAEDSLFDLSLKWNSWQRPLDSKRDRDMQRTDVPSALSGDDCLF